MFTIFFVVVAPAAVEPIPPYPQDEGSQCLGKEEEGVGQIGEVRAEEGHEQKW